MFIILLQFSFLIFYYTKRVVINASINAAINNNGTIKVKKNLNVSFNSFQILTFLKYHTFFNINTVILNINHHANMIAGISIIQ